MRSLSIYARRTAAVSLALLIGLAGTRVDASPRSYEAKAEFKRQHHCPVTDSPKGRCPGYIIDHVKPLACGGADAPENMQWQTVEDAKAKDKWERKGCSS